LGYVVKNGHIETDPDKIQSIISYKAPHNIKTLRRFLGVCAWYRRFINNYSTLTAPLVLLLRKKVRWHWKERQIKSFNELKAALVSAPLLICPDFNYKFQIQCDASDVGLGGVLTQTINGQEHVITYLSRTLTNAEKNYSVTERECLAVLFCIEKCRAYVEGTEFEVITDHASLKWLFTLENPTGRLARWISKIQQYQFNVIHRRGKYHYVSDALSRLDAIDIPDLEPLLDFSQTNDNQYLELKQKISNNPENYK
jgi:hypothetical protein